MRVGHRRLLASRAVAAGPGTAPALSGPDDQRAVVGDARDRAASRADGVDVDHRHVEWPGSPIRPSDVTSASPPRMRQTSALVPPTSTEIRSANTGGLAHQPRADHAGRRARQRGVDRLLAHDVGRDHAAVRLHDPQRRADTEPRAAAPPALRRTARRAAARRRSGRWPSRARTRGTPAARRSTSETAHLRVLREQHLARATLVRRIRRSRAGSRWPPTTRRPRAVGAPPSRTASSSSGSSSSPSTAEAPGDLEDQLGRHRPRRLDPGEHVGVARDVVAADLEHVAKARRGQEPGGRALALEDRVGRGRGAVQHLVELDRAHTGKAQRLVHADEEALARDRRAWSASCTIQRPPTGRS